MDKPRKKIDWPLDEEEQDIISCYIDQYLHNRYMPFDWWMDIAREKIILHHEVKLKENKYAKDC